jgi:hypothetical protein
MKAFVMKEIGHVGFMEKEVPQPGPVDAAVRMTSARRTHDAVETR